MLLSLTFSVWRFNTRLINYIYIYRRIDNSKLKILYKCIQAMPYGSICCTYHHLKYTSPNRSKKKKKKRATLSENGGLGIIHFIIPFGKFGPPYLGKATAGARAALPSHTSAGWVFSCFCNPPNYDMDHRIFNVRTLSFLCVHTGVGQTDRE